MAKNIKYPIPSYPSLEPKIFFQAFPNFSKDDYAEAIESSVDAVYSWLSTPGSGRHRNPTGPVKRHTATIAKDLIAIGCEARIDLSKYLYKVQT